MSTITQITLSDLHTYCIGPDNPDSLVILAHGYGANGMDLIALAEEWAPHCPNTMFISPHAPEHCEAGGPGYQWFSLREYSREFMKEQMREEWVIFNRYIDTALNHFGLRDDQMILSGFSQGCMISLHAGFSREKACAGILGYSGMILDPTVIEKTEHTSIPVHLIHGTEDQVIPVAAWDEAMHILKGKDITVSGHKTDGLPHGIDPQGVESGLEFIKKIFEI